MSQQYGSGQDFRILSIIFLYFQAAIRHEHGTEICGSKIIVEWAKGDPRRPFIVDDNVSYYC